MDVEKEVMQTVINKSYFDLNENIFDAIKNISRDQFHSWKREENKKEIQKHDFT
jgi:hypothetical protein